MILSSSILYFFSSLSPPIQVCRLQEDLAAQYLLYRDELDARKLLIANISSMSYATEEEQVDGIEGGSHLYNIKQM